MNASLSIRSVRINESKVLFWIDCRIYLGGLFIANRENWRMWNSCSSSSDDVVMQIGEIWRGTELSTWVWDSFDHQHWRNLFCAVLVINDHLPRVRWSGLINRKKRIMTCNGISWCPPGYTRIESDRWVKLKNLLILYLDTLLIPVPPPPLYHHHHRNETREPISSRPMVGNCHRHCHLIAWEIRGFCHVRTWQQTHAYVVFLPMPARKTCSIHHLRTLASAPHNSIIFYPSLFPSDNIN